MLTKMPSITDPDDVLSHTNIGMVYYNLKEYKKAREHLERAIVLAPEYIKAYEHLGITYNALKQYPEALGEYVVTYIKKPA